MKIAKHGNTGDTPSFAQWAQADDKDNLSKTVEAMKKQLTQMSASQHNFQSNFIYHLGQVPISWLFNLRKI